MSYRGLYGRFQSDARTTFERDVADTLLLLGEEVPERAMVTANELKRLT